MRALLQRLNLERFARFGSVGALGTVVNLVFLWLGQEWLLARIEPESLRLSLALSLSIAISTVHNFAWNRAWTWADRRSDDRTPLVQQFGQYALACWFGILLQFIVTRALADTMHYMLAAVLAIGLASVANYAINDVWTFGQRLLQAPSARLLLAVQLGLIALTAWAYLYGLDGRNIPKNGDEFVYAHITRLTAESGHWLPLASELDNMRNTKPPLVFWQGLASTQFAAQWELWRLRWPSVAWTFLTALAIGLVAARVGHRVGPASVRAQTVPASAWTPTGVGAAPASPRPARPTAFDLPTGLVAALVWLGFFTTFRYGRPYLTNPPEVFWLSVPMLWLLWTWPRGFESRLVVPLMLGLAIGIGLLAKSFALLAPVGAVLALWWWDHRGWNLGRTLRRDAVKLFVIGAVSLGVFSLWFVLDPDPAAIWREFVIGENVGKIDARGNPLITFFTGPDSVWEYGLAALSNAGLLAGVVLALALLLWRERAAVSPDERRLLLWLAVFIVVFAIPSQRSARYLLPAMPALAILIALRWRELAPWSTRVGHGLALAVVAAFAWLSLGLQEGALGVATSGNVASADLVPPVAWAVYLLAATVALAGVAITAISRTALLAVVALLHLSIGIFLAPFDGRAGDFAADVPARVQGQTVWVPCNFRARFEGHAFLLPGAEPRGYDEREGVSPAALAERYPVFAVRLALHEPAPACAGCAVIGQRLELRTRHSGAEIRAMLAGDAVDHLFVREWLVQASPRPSHAAHRLDAGCR
jgi:putative flippase GtrA